MAGRRPLSFLLDGLITVAAIYLALAAAGVVGVLLFAAGLAPIASLLAYASLLILYAVVTAPGRRAAAFFYVLTGLLYPILAIGLLEQSIGASQTFQVVSGLFIAGIAIGFQASGGPDMPLEGYLPLTYANILGPILLALIARAAWSTMRQA